MSTIDKKADILRKVRAMLAKADSTPEQGEADVFRAKAEQLMLQYRIAEWELGEASEDNHPSATMIDFMWYWDSKHGGSLYSMMLSVAFHCRVKVVHWKAGNSIPVVGLPSDVAYFDMLFTNLMLEMGKGLEPQPDPSKPMIENLVLLKEAGQQWARIAEQLHAIGQLTDEQFTPYGAENPAWTADAQERRKKQIHGLNFSGKYTRYCNENNRERLRVTPKIYQRSFAYGFVDEISRRLREIRSRAQANESSAVSRGNDLVLADIATRAAHKAVELYGAPPQYKGRGGKGKEVRIDGSAVDNGRKAASNVDLGSTKVTQGRGRLGA